MTTFYAVVVTRDPADRKDREWQFYITNVTDEQHARDVLRGQERGLYEGYGHVRFVRDRFEQVTDDGQPYVISAGLALRDRQEKA